MEVDMEQKSPNIRDKDIQRIVRRDFPQLTFTEVEDMLKMYKSESKKGKNRVYASILKLSDGKIELIKKYVEKANTDYRDVIALSEYPNYLEHAFEDELPVEKKKQLIDDDWKQYEAWLNKA
jgi:hypothetical protein